MEFLKYSNENQVNIIPKEGFDELTLSVFNVIAENMAKSLGPLGSSATILDGSLVEATKDGYSIFKSYRFHNRYKKMIYNLIQAPCSRLNDTVGDGTTTAIVFASNLFQGYNHRKAEIDKLYRLPRQFTHAWDEVIAEINSRIQASAKAIDSKDYDTIYNICYVTSNGNHVISDNIAKIYKESSIPYIKEKDSPTTESYVKPINGFDIAINLIDAAYVKNEDLSVEYNDVAILVIDHKVESVFCEKFIFPLNDVMRAKGKKLIVVAATYDVHLCKTTINNYIKNEYLKHKSLNLVLAQYDIDKLAKNQLSDFAVVTRSEIITTDTELRILTELNANENNIDVMVDKIENEDQYEFKQIIGSAESAMMSCENGSIFKVKDIESDERYQKTLLAAKNELNSLQESMKQELQSYTIKMFEARERISQLEMHNYIYYVGANSSLQKNIIWDCIDDVIKCVRSAVKNGIVPGCQLTIASSILKYIKELRDACGVENTNGIKLNSVFLKLNIADMILNAAVQTYQMVIAGPDNTGFVQLLDLAAYKIDRTNKTESIIEMEKNEKRQQYANDLNNKISEIVTTSIDKKQVFDLETLDYTDKIVTSAETDVMVLTAASELVKILISGNQCIFLDNELNNTHTEERDVIV